MRPLGLVLAVCVLLASAAPLRAEDSGDGSPAKTRALLEELDAALKPLRRGAYPEKDRRPVSDILVKLRAEAAALRPSAREFENAVSEALRQEAEFWRSAPKAAVVFPAATAEPLNRRALELAGLFSGLYPAQTLAGSPAARGEPPASIAAAPPDSAIKAAESGKKAKADARLYFDGSGARPDGSFGSPVGGAAAGGAARFNPAARGVVMRASERISDLALGPVPAPEPRGDPEKVGAAAARFVAPAARAALRSVADGSPPARGLVDALRERPGAATPSVPPAEAACREASDGGVVAGLCRSPATAWSAPVAAGLLDAMKEQFGTVSGVVSLLAFTALGLLLSALSGGVGLLATLIKALCGVAVLWTLVSMVARVAAAIREFASTRADDPRHWRALRTIGKVGGELLIVVLVAFAGYKLGERPAVKKAVGSMLDGLQGQMSRLGIRPAAPAPELRAAFSETPSPSSRTGPAGNRSNLVPPEPPPVRPAAAAPPASGRSLSNPSSLRGATADEVAGLIPKDWVARPMRTGRGTIYEMPGTRGADIIQISRGNPRAPDPLHQGTYVKISRAGSTIRIELKP